MRQGIHVNDAELDRILAEDSDILPSHGFTAAVMCAVHREAAMHAPNTQKLSIPFPWHIFLPWLAACLALPCMMLVLALHGPAQSTTQTALQPHWAQVAPTFAEKDVAEMTALSLDFSQAYTEMTRRATQMGGGWLLPLVLLGWMDIQWTTRA